MILVTQGITGGGVLQTDSGGDITRVANVDVLTVIRVHLQDTADTLVLTLGGVENGRTLLYLTGINTEEAELTDIGVSSDLERESGERLVVACVTIDLFAGVLTSSPLIAGISVGAGI